MIYLAWNPNTAYTLERHAGDVPVRLLVALPDIRAFLKVKDRFNIDQWFLDSGAFGAHNSGKPVVLDEYMAICKDTDAAEVAGLDVIGDPDGTRRNVEKMVESGINAIPTFHYGSDWCHLEWAVSFAPKIALGGVARMSTKKRTEWIKQCFARVYPKPMHGFGITNKGVLMDVPFHSVDASSWQLAPLRYGRWRGFRAMENTDR